MVTGRPPKYSKEILELAKIYLKDSFDYPNNNGTFKVNLPSVAGLATYLGVSRSTIYEWKSQHTKFSDILEQILAEQEKRLLNNGLSGTYNSNIVKLALGKHGYHERKELTGAEGKDLFKPTDEEKAKVDEALNS